MERYMIILPFAVLVWRKEYAEKRGGGGISVGKNVWYTQFDRVMNRVLRCYSFRRKRMEEIFAIKEMQELIEQFVEQNRSILKDNLVGVYLHGSAVMGCFHPKESDIDLLVVVKEDISDEDKKSYMDMVVALNEKAPQKGIELSIVKEKDCKPFVYPTPFELHFSIAHLDWYCSNPEDYIAKMKGTDKDLAAHFTIIYHRGRVLYGKDIREVFGEVSSADYMDSIRCDIEGAKEEIFENPMYMILNLCRVLAYKKENLILSKKEGGEWGINYWSEPMENHDKHLSYKKLIEAALKEYETAVTMQMEAAIAAEFAEAMLQQIG